MPSTRKTKGKSPSVQAGEFVRDEIHRVRKGEHGARSAKQIIAIGLSRARRAGVNLPPPKKGEQPEKVRKQAQRDLARGRSGSKPSAKRSRAALDALKKEGTTAASHMALSRQAHRVARNRTPAERSASAKKAARSRTSGRHSASTRKATRTRRRNAV